MNYQQHSPAARLQTHLASWLEKCVLGIMVMNGGEVSALNFAVL
jgi:hypothetical protein